MTSNTPLRGTLEALEALEAMAILETNISPTNSSISDTTMQASTIITTASSVKAEQVDAAKQEFFEKLQQLQDIDSEQAYYMKEYNSLIDKKINRTLYLEKCRLKLEQINQAAIYLDKPLGNKFIQRRWRANKAVNYTKVELTTIDESISAFNMEERRRNTLFDTLEVFGYKLVGQEVDAEGVVLRMADMTIQQAQDSNHQAQ